MPGSQNKKSGVKTIAAGVGLGVAAIILDVILVKAANTEFSLVIPGLRLWIVGVVLIVGGVVVGAIEMSGAKKDG